MKYQYVWLIWSSAFLLPWATLFFFKPRHRGVMLRTSFFTMLLGLTEPLYVPSYWNPPSLFGLAQRTGFDVESFIFCFAIGGIGAVLYNIVTTRDLVSVGGSERTGPRHRLHLWALVAPYVLFVPVYFLPWNAIYPSILCLIVGAAAACMCRPDITRKSLVGGLLFLGLYAAFMLGLRIFAPGYIEAVWNLPALSGLLFAGIPLEELAFGFSFGLYWTGLYEHFSWTRAALASGIAAPRSDDGAAGQ